MCTGEDRSHLRHLMVSTRGQMALLGGDSMWFVTPSSSPMLLNIHSSGHSASMASFCNRRQRLLRCIRRAPAAALAMEIYLDYIWEESQFHWFEKFWLHFYNLLIVQSTVNTYRWELPKSEIKTPQFPPLLAVSQTHSCQCCRIGLKLK